MRLLSLVLALVLALAAFSSVGCTRTSTIRIRNPAQIGHVEPNRVPIEYARSESLYALPPGSLTDEASLQSFEPRGACFAVTLRNFGEEAASSTLAGYSIRLTGPNDLEIETPAYVQPTETTVAQFQGQVPEQHQTGTTTQCVDNDPNTGACRRWDTQPVYDTVWVPGVVQVVTGGGTVCFANNGQLTPRTQGLSLDLRMRDVSASNKYTTGRFSFVWEFDSVQAPAQHPQQGRPAQSVARR